MDKLAYWVALPPEEAVPEAHKHVRRYYSILRDTGHLDKIEKAYQMYWGLGDYDSASMSLGGDQDELIKIRINHLRSIISHVLVLVTQNRPALKAVAVNNDVASQNSARLGDTLIDYYFGTKSIEEILKEAAELSLVTSLAYVVMEWDTTQGQEYGATQAGQVIYDGDIKASAKSCLEVISDIYAESNDWYIIREKVNKYDLAAQFPEKAEEICNVKDPDLLEWGDRYFDTIESDLVWRYTLVHRKTPAVPTGRYMRFLEGDIMLTDGPLPYRDTLCFPIHPGKIGGTKLGYTPAFDLLSVNEALNDVWSAIVTNLSTFGVSNVWTPTGSNLNVTQLAGGMNHIEADQKPEAINLSQMPAELMNATDKLRGEMEMLSGINDVVRGNPQASLRSGEALALVAAQAIAYNSGLQQSFYKLLEKVGNGIVGLLKDYATTPKMIAIVGNSRKSYLKQFTGDSLNGIDRVMCEQVSAVSKTTAGRIDIANQLLQAQLLPDPQAYLTLIETGRIDPLLDPVVNEKLLIQQENELLRDGSNPVQAVITEDHSQHIKGHREVLSDPLLKLDPEVLNRVLSHIQEHIMLGSSPEYMQLAPLFGHQPIPPPPMPAMPGVNGEMMQPVANEPTGEMPGIPQPPEGTPAEFDGAIQQQNNMEIPS